MHTRIHVPLIPLPACPPPLLPQVAAAAAEPPPPEEAGDLLRPEYATDEFRMFSFKIDCCPRLAESHDWTLCPFQHPGESSRWLARTAAHGPA